MRITVDFHDEKGTRSEKIRDETANLDLFLEGEAAGPFAQQVPESELTFGEVSSQEASTLLEEGDSFRMQGSAHDGSLPGQERPGLARKSERSVTCPSMTET
jgi:hypothetical protein